MRPSLRVLQHTHTSYLERVSVLVTEKFRRAVMGRVGKQRWEGNSFAKSFRPWTSDWVDFFHEIPMAGGERGVKKDEDVPGLVSIAREEPKGGFAGGQRLAHLTGFSSPA